MKIIFIGSVIFSKIVLENLLNYKVKINGVISLKPNKKSFKSDFYDLKKICRIYNISNICTSNINNKKNLSWIKKINPDLILCVGWSQIISKELLSTPRIGLIGYHPSLLPNNRGKHPIIWALALGLQKTGSTFFKMDSKIDNGKIISQKTIKISKNDDATSLYYKLAEKAKTQILSILKKINKNDKIFTIKVNKSKTNYWRSRNIEDGEINWSSSSNTVHNLVRSLAFPYPNAHFYYKGKLIKVTKTVLGKNREKNIEYGKIISVKKNTYEIKCGVSSIYLLEMYPNIKMKVGEYL